MESGTGLDGNTMLSHVPIPRLPNHYISQKSGRVARACDECRSHKSRCDGNRPTCSQCDRAGLETCNYSETKRTREQKELELANREVDRYERLLREISQEVEISVATKIMEALRPSFREQALREEASTPSSTSSAVSVGSLDVLDTIDEDVNRNKISRATGYIGKSSEVAWMQSLEREARGQPGKEGNLENCQQFQPPLASVNYHIESPNYPDLEDDGLYVLPAKTPAERLLRLYLDSVQPSLPVIRQGFFTDQFRSLYSGKSIFPGRKWLAVLNLIFAISSKLCQLSGQDIQNSDHKFFFKAQKLNISESLVEDHEDLQQVQAETLAALYLMTSSQVNRAWKMIGTATRSAIALGLHLRATHNKWNALALEARHKLWWSIFILENQLSIMTGRASGLRNSFCSVPPPLVSDVFECSTNSAPDARPEWLSENPHMKWTIYLERERLKGQRASMRLLDATEGLFFFCLADLVVISHTASTRVYNTDAVKQGWNQIQSRIDFYNRTMEDWRSNLPKSLGFEVISAGPVLSIGDTYRVSLAMHYYSSRMTLNKPCLTRPKKGGEGGEGGVKKRLSRPRKDIETTCLHSALAILCIFPNLPDPAWACYVPWWNVLHFLVQTTTVLLITISHDFSPPKRQRSQNLEGDSSASQLPESEIANPEAIRTATKKALQWLRCLGETDNSARRAFELCSSCVRHLAPNDFDLIAFTNSSSNIPSLDVPAGQTHQQYRSKLGVPCAQFAGIGGLCCDRNTGSALTSEPGATKSFEVPQQRPFGTMGDDIDMADYIPALEHATFDEVLRSLAEPDNEAI